MKSDNVKAGMQQAPHRSLFNALGFTEEEITVCREIFTRMCQNAAEGLNPSDTDGI